MPFQGSLFFRNRNMETSIIEKYAFLKIIIFE